MLTGTGRSSAATRHRRICRPRSGAFKQLSSFYAKHVAYAQIMTTRPQTSYGLADLPADLAAFKLDHGHGTGHPRLVEQALQGHLASDLT